MKVPDWLELALLGLASYRVWRLLAEDVILAPARRWLVRLPAEWDGDPDTLPPTYRETLNVFVSCPWCLGFWIALAWWGAFELDAHVSLIVAAPFAVSTIVGFLAKVGGD